MILRYLAACFMVILLAGGAAIAATTQVSTVSSAPAAPVEIAPPSPNDIKEFMRLLSDEQMRNWLQQSALETGQQVHDVGGISLREQITKGMMKVRTRLRELGEAWVLLPHVPDLLEDRWEKEMKLHRKVRSLTFLVIFLFVGAGLEWLYRQYTRLPLLRLEMQVHNAPIERARAALARAAIVVGGQALFALGSIGTFLSFDWPPLVESVVLNLLVVIIVVRAVRALSIFILAPKVPELRLVPLSRKMAKHLHLYLPLVATSFAIAIAVNNVFAQLSQDTDARVAQATLAESVILGLGIVAMLFVTIRQSFRLWCSEQKQPTGPAPHHWQNYLYVMVGVVFLLWLFDTGALMWSVLVLATLFPLIKILNAWVDYFFDQAVAAIKAEQALEAEEAREEALAEAKLEAVEAGTSADETPPEPVQHEPEEQQEPLPGTEPYSTIRLISKRFVRLLVVITALVLLGAIWGFNMLSSDQPASFTARVFSVLADTAFVVLVADLIWTWAKTAIDQRLAAYVPPEGSEAPGPEARMATLLPLLRMTLLVALITAVAVSILSSLGVNIAPLIAGAGVVGIAIGFGAQSLVRDVVSGIFFLIDDAFRLGEYIEIGELRGTVESISIRSLRVRHHRGAIHTIPFGELKYLTNHSRDWVIMKLEFRVPFDTDLKLVKKLVKQVGAKLKENEFYGDSILQTLKSQGVRRMEEFNMVVGVKFMTKPGEQWLVRRDAYQMVRDIFEANGIRMAERNVKVEIEGGEGLSEAEKEAAAGAAQVAAEGPKIPPGPVPDEP